jgi:prepilin-type N-terminal cleavage/methylation domain-containing protein
MKIKRGFSLIELMVGIAIIGVLAGIAIPSYRTHTIKARVSEAFSVADPCQIQIEQFYFKNGSLPTTAQITGIGFNSCNTDPSILVSPYVSNVFYWSGSVTGRNVAQIQITLSTNSSLGSAAGGMIWLDSFVGPNNTLQWFCRVPTWGTAVPTIYLPASILPCQ